MPFEMPQPMITMSDELKRAVWIVAPRTCASAKFI